VTSALSRKEFFVLKNATALLKDDAGQGLVEYALIIALISLAAIAVMSTLGKKVSNSLNSAVASLS
jgi:pilus assembly protein Flp/PilA